MRDFEAITGYRVHVVAVQLVARSEADGVNETVEFRPCFCQFSKHAVDAFVLCNVTFQNDAGTQLRGKLFNTAFQLVVLVGERQLSAFAMHCLCDAVCDGQFAGNASHQNALTGKKTHSFNPYIHCLFCLVIHSVTGSISKSFEISSKL